MCPVRTVSGSYFQPRSWVHHSFRFCFEKNGRGYGFSHKPSTSFEIEFRK